MVQFHGRQVGEYRVAAMIEAVLSAFLTSDYIRNAHDCRMYSGLMAGELNFVIILDNWDLNQVSEASLRSLFR